jgi:hypothetical protein
LHPAEDGSTTSKASHDESELYLAPKDWKRIRVIHGIAEQTQSVLYHYNKKNLKAFLQTTENVIILKFFLEKSISVYQKYQEIHDREAQTMAEAQKGKKTKVSFDF